MSFGFVNQSMGGNFQGTSSLPASDSLTAGRGCPVGDAAAERSPVLSPSPPDWINRFHDSVTMPHSLHFQASSTPMVREVLFPFKEFYQFTIGQLIYYFDPLN